MSKERTYLINEVFYSVQGEGMRAGTANVFVRFSKCNMRCAVLPGDRSPGGFDCDTEFESGRRVTKEELLDWIYGEARAGGHKDTETLWVICTGGEPALQLDNELCGFLHAQGILIAVETNGSMLLPHVGDPEEDGLEAFSVDWITVSPKVAEHAIAQRWAHEVKYVRGYGQAIPQTVVNAHHQLISPAFFGLEQDQRAVQWCVELVKQNPEWRLCAQLHKLWSAR